MIDTMEKETVNIKKEVLKFCWYMRGGITYDEAMQLSSAERQVVSEIINENLETTKKSGLPFF